MRNNPIKLNLIALGVNIFEWYEFSVSAYLAIAIAHALFPSTHDVYLAITESFLVFALSYIVRPIGSIIFGYIGDRINVATSLKYTIFMMAIPTILIGVIPSFSQIGYFATLIFALLRIIQGLAAGGALPLSAAYVFEHGRSYSNNLNFLCSLTNVGALLGVLLASLSAMILSLSCSDVQIYTYAWRLPYLVVFLLLILTLYLIKNINVHSGNVNINSKSNEIAPHSLPNAIIYTITLVGFLQIVFYTLFVWMPTYLQAFIHLSSIDAKLSNTIAILVLVFTSLIYGYLGKWINPHKLIIVGIAGLLIATYPLFILVQSANLHLIIIVQLLFAVIYGLINGSYFFTILHKFNSNQRNRGVTIGFTLGTALFGGSAPVICNYFTAKLNLLTFPALYIIFTGFVALFIVGRVFSR